MPFDPFEIKRLRKNLKMTQLQFGNAVGVPPTTVHRWEARSSTPNTKHLSKIYDLAFEKKEIVDFFKKPVPKG